MQNTKIKIKVMRKVVSAVCEHSLPHARRERNMDLLQLEFPTSILTHDISGWWSVNIGKVKILEFRRVTFTETIPELKVWVNERVCGKCSMRERGEEDHVKELFREGKVARHVMLKIVNERGKKERV